MKFALVALGAVLCSAQADATGFSTETQSFYTYFSTHGSSGVATIDQYSGPLRLYGVRIDWSGWGDEGGFNPSADGDNDPFEQPYTGEGHFDIEDDFYNEAASGEAPFSGVSECTNYLCEIGGDVSGVTFADPARFIGLGSLTIMNLSSIGPDLSGSGYSTFYEVGVSGTVTYTLGPVPEPGSWAMMLGGFAFVGGALRRRRQAAISFGQVLPTAR